MKKNDKTNQPLSLWSNSLWFYASKDVKHMEFTLSYMQRFTSNRIPFLDWTFMWFKNTPIP